MKKKKKKKTKNSSQIVEKLKSVLGDAGMESEGANASAIFNSLNRKCAVRGFVKDLNPSIKLRYYYINRSHRCRYGRGTHPCSSHFYH